MKKLKFKRSLSSGGKLEHSFTLLSHLEEAHHYDGGTHIGAVTRQAQNQTVGKNKIISVVKMGGNSLGEQPLHWRNSNYLRC